MTSSTGNERGGSSDRFRPPDEGAHGHSSPPWCDREPVLAIVTALELEAAPLRERLSDATTFRPGDLVLSAGRLGRTAVCVLAGGVGRRAAAHAARLMIDGHRPSRIVSAGLCGGLLAALVRNAVFVPEGVMTADGLERIPLDIPACLRRSDIQSGGWLATSDRVVSAPAAKRALQERLQAAAVDMESFGIAREAAARGIRATVVRVVCDAVDDPIPEDIAQLVACGGGARQAGAALRLAWRRPSALVELVALREQAHVAAERLVPVIEHLAAAELPAD
jgi:nucleoside phosphorylase